MIEYLDAHSVGFPITTGEPVTNNDGIEAAYKTLKVKVSIPRSSLNNRLLTLKLKLPN